MGRILFVDPDEVALQAQERALRRQRRVWDMEFVPNYESAVEAMDIETPTAVVVASVGRKDPRSIDFLTQSREKHPSAVRISVSPGNDAGMLFESANLAHQSLEKPFESYDLEVVLARALALRERLENCSLRERLHQVGGLPSLPELYQRIVEEMSSPHPSIASVADLIQQDVSMSAKLLQVINSAAVGMKHEVTSITRAAALLGLEKLGTLVLVVEIFALADRAKLPKGFSLEALWQHSLRVAGYAKQIMQEETDDRKVIEAAFTGGLLHDVGLIIMVANFSEELGEALESARAVEGSLWGAERHVFQATHAEVGGYLLELWGLPDLIVEAITFHDFPSAMPENYYSTYMPEHGLTPLTAVHIANYLCEDERMAAYGCSEGEVDTMYMERLGFLERLEEWVDLCQGEDE